MPLKQERIGMRIVWLLLGLALVVGFIPFRHASVWTIYAATASPMLSEAARPVS